MKRTQEGENYEDKFGKTKQKDKEEHPHKLSINSKVTS